MKICFFLFIVVVSACSDNDGRGISPGPENGTQPGLIKPGTLSGKLAVAAGTAVDGDTNDPDDPRTPNDTLPGQKVSMPVTIGGYASLPITNLDKTDEFDIYRVTLLAPTTITLSIGNPDQGDLDLFLTDVNGAPLKNSVGNGRFEVIDTGPIAQAGDFLVMVRATSGASTYILSIGITPASSNSLLALTENNQGLLSSDMAFVPNEIIVKFKEGPDNSISKSMTSSMVDDFGMDNLGLQLKASSPSGSLLMTLNEGGNGTFQMQNKTRQSNSPLHYKTKEDEEKALTLLAIKALRKRADIEYAHPNYISHATAIPNDAFFRFQWHYPLINLPQAWDITKGSNDVVIAVIDTGVVIDHPDLNSRLLRDSRGNLVGYDFISDPQNARDGDGIDPNPLDEGDLANQGRSSSFHGTHVSGTIAAATNNASGVAGVTWLGKIMPLRVLGVQGGSSFDIAQAILYAAGLPNLSGTLPAIKANIINMSLGLGNESCQVLPPIDSTTRNAINQAMATGVIVIVAAGNDNCPVPGPLTTIEGVISVGAVDLNKQRAPYSNFGSTLDVVAPGGDARVDRDGDGFGDGVLSTLADDSNPNTPLTFNFIRYQGTSMAAPHMSGVVALMLAVNPGLTPGDINQLLAGTHLDLNAGPITQDLGISGRDDTFGHGMIDAFKAVSVARSVSGGSGGGTPPPPDIPVLNVSPRILNFGLGTSTLQLTINNAGTGQLVVTSVTTDGAPWLEIDQSALPAVIRVSVNRTELLDGSFLGNITINSNGGNRSVRVFMQVQSGFTGGDIGSVFVLVLDPETFAPVEQTVTTALQNYRYQIPELAGGEYIVVAGTDIDNDGIICGAGEACGIFPLIDSPSPVKVDGNVSAVDFPTAYQLFSTGDAVLSFDSDLKKRFALSQHGHSGFKLLR